MNLEHQTKNTEKVHGLSELFVDCRIYPLRCYQGSFVDHFCQTHPDDHYAKDLEVFLRLHGYEQERIGADLPWWGKHYFSDKPGKRTFLIAQDSNSDDAGSVTFYSNLMPIMDEQEYKRYVQDFQRFDGWNMARELFSICGIDLDFAYITDARKVYPKESIAYKSAVSDSIEVKELKAKYRRKLLASRKNAAVNKELLIRELEYCAPDVVIIFGSSGLELLGVTEKITPLLERDCSVSVDGKTIFVAPFPSRANNGVFRKFKDRAAERIRAAIADRVIPEL